MFGGQTLDFDNRDGKKVLQSAYTIAKEAQDGRNEQYLRNNNLYHGYKEVIDTDKPNVHIPKTYNIVETIVPRHIKATMATRPYIPFTTRREELQPVAAAQAEFLDEHLHMAGFKAARILQTKIAVMHGTAYMDAVPYFENVTEKMPIQTPMGMQLVERTVPRFRFRLKVWAPWEVYVDPYATGLRTREDCRFVIKVQLVSRRQLTQMAMRGAYPDYDIQRLYKKKSTASTERQEHWGLHMVKELGLNIPESDDDMGILLRYESPDRYIDCWNGDEVLRDIPNPYKHGLINLSKLIYVMTPHPQNCFYGMGAIKPNEILQHLLDDTWNMTLLSHALINQPVTYYRDGVGMESENLVRAAGNKIRITDNDNSRPIRDHVYLDEGRELPSSHYMIPEITENHMDLTSGVYDMQRGDQEDRSSTASEAAMRKDAGDTRLEMGIWEEEEFLDAYTFLRVSDLEQFTSIDDRLAILGPRKAQQMFTANPYELQGGVKMEFKGADRVGDQMLRQRNLKELTPMMLGLPNTLPGEWGKILLSAFELEDEAERVLIPDQILFQMQSQQNDQQAQQQAAEGEQRAQQQQMQGERKHQQALEMEGAKAQYKVNTTQQEAENVGREYTRGQVG